MSKLRTSPTRPQQAKTDRDKLAMERDNTSVKRDKNKPTKRQIRLKKKKKKKVAK